MKKLVNAGIKSVEELATRLAGGEEFITPQDSLLRFDKNHTNPFRIVRGMYNDAMHRVWELYAELRIEQKVPWYESIPEGGVLCYVSDDQLTPDVGCRAYRVLRYSPHFLFPFRTTSAGWKYATPVNPADCCAELFTSDTDGDSNPSR